MRDEREHLRAYAIPIDDNDKIDQILVTTNLLLTKLWNKYWKCSLI